MKIYDISQEVFSCQVYPDDPTPEKKMLKAMEKGEECCFPGELYIMKILHVEDIWSQ